MLMCPKCYSTCVKTEKKLASKKNKIYNYTISSIYKVIFNNVQKYVQYVTQ